MSKQGDKALKSRKSIEGHNFIETEKDYYKVMKQSKTKHQNDDAEILRKFNIPFNDDDDFQTPSLMTLASALPDTDCIDSTGDNIHTKSTSYNDYEGATSFEDDVYSDYDFDDEYEEDASSNTKYNFKIYHDVMEEMSMMEKKKYKNGTRASLTFSNQRVKEIERDNRILLEKIMRNGPSGETSIRQQSSNKNQRPKIKTAAEINRQRKQQQINYENQILKRKLEKIAARRASVSNTSS